MYDFLTNLIGNNIIAFFIAAAALSKLYEGLIVLAICSGLCLAGLLFLIAGIRVYRYYLKRT